MPSCGTTYCFVRLLSHSIWGTRVRAWQVAKWCWGTPHWTRPRAVKAVRRQLIRLPVGRACPRPSGKRAAAAAAETCAGVLLKKICGSLGD
eukprot:COSAG05_NODE_48_length_24425_cov_90.438543_33_plen_91_part_00